MGNQPKKGDKISVEPIRSLRDIKTIAKGLENSPRNHLLFIMGINNGLRVGDLLKLKIHDVRHLKVGSTHTIIEGKTGKENILAINKVTYRSLKNYFEKVNADNDGYLFASRKGDGPLTISSVNRLLKQWTREIHLKGNYGAHTLRKTFGYIQRKEKGVGFEILCKRYNHSSPAITMRYLGIQDKEIENILMYDIG